MLGSQGADFLGKVAFWSVGSSGLLRLFCLTGTKLRMTWFHFFKGMRSTLERWDEKITKCTGSGPSALHGRISFAPQGRFLSEVSQNCLVLIF